jgi:hypothetical protein
MAAWGVPALSHPFADWAAVVRLMHCADRGMDVYVANSCGVFSYSPLWLWAGQVPLDPAWRNVIGLSIDAAFFGSLWIVLRPKTWRESILFTVVCVSPTVLYAAERANVDLIIFLVVASAAEFIGCSRRWRPVAYLLVGLAGLLKFYPFAGLFVAIRETNRRFLTIALIALLAAASILFAMRGHLVDLSANLPSRDYDFGAFGAGNVLYLLGPASPTFSMVTIALFWFGALATGILTARDAALAQAFGRLGDRDRDTLVLGSAIVAGCFLAVDNVMYRAVFLIFVVAGLIALRRTSVGGTRIRLAVLSASIVALMWSDALWQVLYPHSKLIGPVFTLILLLGREIIWWYLIASLLGLLVIAAHQSNALSRASRWLEGRVIGRAR